MSEKGRRERGGREVGQLNHKLCLTICSVKMEIFRPEASVSCSADVHEIDKAEEDIIEVNRGFSIKFN